MDKVIFQYLITYHWQDKERKLTHQGYGNKYFGVGKMTFDEVHTIEDYLKDTHKDCNITILNIIKLDY